MAVSWTWPNILWLSGLVTAGLQLLTFLVAYLLQFDKLTDISGTSNFVLLGWLSYALGAHRYTRQTVNTLLLTAWGVRLGSYLLLRVVRRGHDARFDEMRASVGRFGGFFVFQAFWVFLVTLPILLSNATRYDVPIGARDYVGWTLWTVGFLVEVWADQSKDAFYEQRRSSSSTSSSSTRGIITTGCWSWSRHPNYWAEITLWLGLFLSCSSSFDAPNNLKGAYPAGLLSPIFTFVILMFLSGCPLAEQRYNERHGSEGWYLAYRAQTSPLIPLPPFLYRSLPTWMKSYLLFELDMYKKGLPATGVAAGGEGEREGGMVKGSPNKTTNLIEGTKGRPEV
jgi:steroid 5-alpha reductase family enzyme